MLFGIAAGIIIFLFVSPVFNIQEIIVEGESEISESVYIATSGIEIGENIFGIDKNSGIVEIKKDPYVESVEINSIYPNKIEIIVVERTVSYILEQNGRYYCIDKNGYILETGLSQLDFPEIKGYNTNLEEKELGQRLDEEDLSKFNDLIKIIDAVKSNITEAKLTGINIQDNKNYILEFNEENKNIMLGEAKDLVAKMAWINLFIKEKKNESITIYLNTGNVYFSPKEGG